MSTTISLRWPAIIIARFRDALRTLRGRQPKYSSIARHFVSDHQLACLATANMAAGICTEADVNYGALTSEENGLLKACIAEARELSGPIVQIGTLLGETTSKVCLWKSAEQKVYAIDRAFANPWGLPPATYRALVKRTLKYLVRRGRVVHLSMKPSEFFKTHRHEPPSLVLIDYAQSEKEVGNIIRWAKKVGAGAIAGRGYSFATRDVMRAVDDAGGPDAVEGNFWRLQLNGVVKAAAGINAAVSRENCAANSPMVDGLVSIVIPAYNARDHIDATLDDITRQLYRNWELIVVEDGSLDPVETSLERFQTRHPDHRIVYKRRIENEGVSRTRNEAFRLCRGEYIAFLDADDGWTADHLQRKVRLMRQTCADVVYSSVDAFDSKTGQFIGNWGPTSDDLHYFPNSMFYRPYIQPSGVVMRQSVVAEVGEIDESLHFAEDYDYFFRVIRAGKRFFFDDKTTSRYRKGHASAATTDRLVLCCDGIANVTERFMSLNCSNDRHRRHIVAKHFLMAGSGHLAYRPSERNGCNPELGKRYLLQTLRLGRRKRGRPGYYLLAKFAVATRTTPVFRSIFRRRFLRCVSELGKAEHV
jgi:glycosyltransferase involved in cell wall biosynthesis